MLRVTAKQQGNEVIAVENGIGWSHKTKGSVKVKNRPFTDWCGKVLTFNSMEHCIGWCNTRNSLMNIVHF